MFIFTEHDVIYCAQCERVFYFRAKSRMCRCLHTAWEVLGQMSPQDWRRLLAYRLYLDDAQLNLLVARLGVMLDDLEQAPP